MTSRPTWVFGGIMALCMCVTALPTYALGTLAPFISEEMDMDRAQLGSLTTMLFIVGSVTSPSVGRLVDRVGGYRMLQVSFLTSIVALTGFATSFSYVTMLIFIAIVGLGRAISNPVTNTLIAVSGVPGRIGTLMGITKSGAQVSAVLAGVLLPPLAVAFGWRLALVAAAALALAGLLATPLIVSRDGPHDRRVGGSPPATAMPASATWLTVYAFLMGAGIACVNAYLPLFAYEEVGMAAGAAGTVMGAMGVVSIPGRIIWARTAERQPNVAVPLLVIACSSAGAVGILMSAQALGQPALWIGSIVFGLAAASWIAVGMLTIVRISETGASGRVSGRVLAGFYGGFVASPIVFGHQVDVRGDYVLSWLLVIAAFGLAAGLTTWWAMRYRRQSEPV